MSKGSFNEKLLHKVDITKNYFGKGFGTIKNRKLWKIIAVVLGVFLLVSVPVLYLYVLPDNLLVPTEFGFDVKGEAYVWTIIGNSNYYDAILVGKVENVDTKDKEALIYKGLLKEDTKEVITVLFDFLNISEWTHIDARLKSLKSTRASDGYVLVPGTGVPGSEIKEGDIIDYVVVESYGVRDGKERSQINMKLKNTGKTKINGLTVWIWETTGEKEAFYLHGLDLYLTYCIKIAVEPLTGYILSMNFKFDFYLTPANLLDALKDERVDVTQILSKLKDRFFGIFKHKNKQQIRSMSLQDLRDVVDVNIFIHAATLGFETDSKSTQELVEDATEFRNLMLIINPGIGVTLAIVGVLLLWGSIRFYPLRKKR